MQADGEIDIRQRATGERQRQTDGETERHTERYREEEEADEPNGRIKRYKGII